MRRYVQTLTLILSAAATLTAATVNDALAKMNETGPSFRGMTANLTRVTFTKVLNEKTTESGTIRLRKQGKELQTFIEFTQPDPKLVAFHGRKAEIFLPKLNTVQEYDLGKQSDLLDQFLLVGFGTTGKDLTANYSPKLVGEETVAGQKTWHLDLTPLNPKVKDKFRRLDLWLDETGGYPVQQRFVQPSGDYYLFTYADVKLNPALTDDALKLKLPKGVKREFPQK